MKRRTKAYLISLITIILLSHFPGIFSQEAGKTVIHGIVLDSKTLKPVVGTNVFFENSLTGTITGNDGKYTLETTAPYSRIVFSFISYKSEIRSIIKGADQTVNINLNLSSYTLDEVKVVSGKSKYSNKNNPAVQLIEKVIENKDENRNEKFDYLEYEKYEKLQFAVSNFTEKAPADSLNNRFSFIFDNVDTTNRVGNSILPMYIREVMSDKYYSKVPERLREIIRAEKNVEFGKYLDNKGVSEEFNYMYQNINLYDNEILFLTKKFISPVAGSAPLFYRYYIIDTLDVDDIKCIRLFFTPRNKSDFLFQGYLYIAHDNNYAIRKVDMGINKKINVDWVQDISINQDFEYYRNEGWLLSKDETAVNLGILKNAMGLFGKRTILYSNYKINVPPDEKIFSGPDRIERLVPASDNDGYWELNRPVPLTNTEKGIYTMTDSLMKIRSFKNWMNAIMMFPNDFLNLGKIEIGPEDSFFSFNPAEGKRIRLGGRTTPDFSKKVTYDGYLAYGFSDKTLKFSSGITYSLTKGTIYEFPVKSISIHYLKDVSIPGQELRYLEEDIFFTSFKRGVDDKFLMNRTFSTEYLNEFENHFSYKLGYIFTNQSTLINLHFNPVDYLSAENEINSINVSELSLNLRYAPNESFYQNRLYREVYPGKYPVFLLKTAVGSKSILNDYNYLRLQLDISKRFYVSVLGFSDVRFEAGKIFGKVPYTLLFMNRANQTYSYEKSSYNLMNFLEFVDDQYVSLSVDHCFDGFFLNKIPLIKRLKLREMATCKVLYGGLAGTNNPDFQDDLFKFPVNSDGVPLTYTLGKQPYIEASIGISNIMKVLRVDLIKRFTYLDNPNVSSTGVRFLLEFNL